MFRIIEVDKGIVPKGNVKLYGKRTFKDYYIEAMPTKTYDQCKTEYDYDMRSNWKEYLLKQGKNLRKKDDFELTRGGLGL